MIINLQNISLYLQDVEAILKKNKEQILKNFCDSPGVPLDKVGFQLEILGEETHNKGQSPVQVALCHEERILGRVVYKPRNAETEISVLQLFAALNRADPGNHAIFHIYKIESLQLEGSIWEFVEGKHFKGSVVAEHLENIERDAPQDFALAQASLQRLQTICTKIGVTDLHPENVILVDGVRWVPIDLEVIKHGNETGLYDRGEQTALLPLTIRETELVKQFNLEQNQRLARAVPVSTCDLGNAGKYVNGAEKIVSSLYEVLNREYTFIR